MRDELLYIDGELVDLDDNTKITLNIKSNLFTDLSKIVGNNSYTIKLPKTVRNQRIINHADIPTADATYSRKYHHARYFRDGVEIIPDAKAVLLSVSDTIDIAMTWGTSVSISSLIKNNKTLNDLNEGSFSGGVYWPRYREWKNWGENSIVFPQVDYGLKLNETEAWYHPAETINGILDYITEDIGVTFDFPQDKKNLLNNYFIPLLTRNPSEKYAEMESLTVDIKGVAKDNVDKICISFGEKEGGVSSYFGDLITAGGGTIASYFNSYRSSVANAIPKISGDIEVIAQIDSEPASAYLEVYNYNFSAGGSELDSSTVLEIPVLYVTMLSEGKYKIVFSFTDEQTSMLSTAYSSTPYMKFALGNVGNVVSISGTLKIFNIEQEIKIGGRFWTIPNLPSIKIVDFLKAISALVGVFPAYVKDNIIKFISLDDLINNKSKALNWTRKVIASYQDNKPKDISYTIEDFAQRNYFRWKEDKSVIGDFDSYLKVDNETIDYERDAITLPFAPSNMFSNIARIPIYSYDKNEKGDDILQYDNVEPRILEYSGVKGVFSMRWEKLLSLYYIKYQNLIRNPIVITEKIEISNIDLKNIDVTVPVYLAQYGRYYAIISIKAENTGICECKLLQLEV